MPLYGKIVVIRRNGTDGSQFPLTSASCLFGRSLECDIRVQLPYVSNKQCKLEITEDGEYFLNNLSNSNDTIVNGKPVKGKVVVKNNDVFTLVDRSFRFEFPENVSQVKSNKRVSLVLQESKRNALQLLDQNRESNMNVVNENALGKVKTPKRLSLSSVQKQDSETTSSEEMVLVKENTPAKIKTPKRKSISSVQKQDSKATSSEEMVSVKENTPAKMKTPKRKSISSVQKQGYETTSSEEMVSVKENTPAKMKTPKRKSISSVQKQGSETTSSEEMVSVKENTPDKMKTPKRKSISSVQKQGSETTSSEEMVSVNENTPAKMKTPKRKSISSVQKQDSEATSSEEMVLVKENIPAKMKTPKRKSISSVQKQGSETTSSEEMVSVKENTPAKMKTPKRKSISSVQKQGSETTSSEEMVSVKENTPAKPKTPKRKSISKPKGQFSDTTTSSEEIELSTNKETSTKSKTPERKSVSQTNKAASDSTDSNETDLKEYLKVNIAVRPNRKSISAFEEYQSREIDDQKRRKSMPAMHKKSLSLYQVESESSSGSTTLENDKTASSVPNTETPKSLPQKNKPVKRLAEEEEVAIESKPQRRTSPRTSFAATPQQKASLRKTADGETLSQDVIIEALKSQHPETGQSAKTPNRKSISKLAEVNNNQLDDSIKEQTYSLKTPVQDSVGDKITQSTPSLSESDSQGSNGEIPIEIREESVTPRRKSHRRKSSSSAKKALQTPLATDIVPGFNESGDIFAPSTSVVNTPNTKVTAKDVAEILEKSESFMEEKTSENSTSKTNSFASEGSSVPDFTASRELIEAVTPELKSLNSTDSDSESSLTSMDVDEFIASKSSTSSGKTSKRSSFNTSGDLLASQTPTCSSFLEEIMLEESEKSPLEKRRSIPQPVAYVSEFNEKVEEESHVLPEENSSPVILQNVSASRSFVDSPVVSSIKRKSIREMESAKMRNWSPLPKVNEVENNSSPRKRPPSFMRRLSNIKGATSIRKSQRVSFGPSLSPEQFLLTLPPNTPVKRGALPPSEEALEVEEEKMSSSAARAPTPFKPRSQKKPKNLLRQAVSFSMRTRSSPPQQSASSDDALATNLNDDFQQCSSESSPQLKHRKRQSKSNTPIARRRSSLNGGLWSQVVRKGRKNVAKPVVSSSQEQLPKPKKEKRRLKTPARPHHIDSPATIYIGKRRKRVQNVKTPKAPFAIKQQKLNLPLNESLTGIGDMFQTPQPNFSSSESSECSEELISEDEIYVDMNGSYTEGYHSVKVNNVHEGRDENDFDHEEIDNETPDHDDIHEICGEGSDSCDEIHNETPNHDDIHDVGDEGSDSHEGIDNETPDHDDIHEICGEGSDSCDEIHNETPNHDEIHEICGEGSDSHEGIDNEDPGHDDIHEICDKEIDGRDDVENISRKAAKTSPVKDHFGIKRLVKTPRLKKQKTQPVEDNFAIRKLMTTPKERPSKSQPVEDNFAIRKLMTTPKERPAKSQPVEDNFAIRKLMTTPKQRPAKSQPVEDNFAIRKLMTTPKQRPAKSQPVEDHFAIRKMMTTPKQRPAKSQPVEDNFAIRKLMTTPKQRPAKSQPVEDNFGIRKMMTTPKERPAKSQPVDDHYDIANLFLTPNISVQTKKQEVEKTSTAKKVKKAKKEPAKKCVVRSTRNSKKESETKLENEAVLESGSIKENNVSAIEQAQPLVESTLPLDSKAAENLPTVEALPESVDEEIVLEEENMVLVEPQVLQVELSQSLKRKVTFHESVYSPLPKVQKKARNAAPKKEIDVGELQNKHATRSRDKKSTAKKEPAKRTAKAKKTAVKVVETKPAEIQESNDVVVEIKEPEASKPVRETRGRKRKISADKRVAKKPALDKAAEATAVVATGNPLEQISQAVEKPTRKTRSKKNDATKSVEIAQEAVEIATPTLKNSRTKNKIAKTSQEKPQNNIADEKENVEIIQKVEKAAGVTKPTRKNSRTREAFETTLQAELPQDNIADEKDNVKIIQEVKKAVEVIKPTRKNSRTRVKKAVAGTSQEQQPQSNISAENQNVEIKSSRSTRARKVIEKEPVQEEGKKVEVAPTKRLTKNKSEPKTVEPETEMVVQPEEQLSVVKGPEMVVQPEEQLSVVKGPDKVKKPIPKKTTRAKKAKKVPEEQPVMVQKPTRLTRARKNASTEEETKSVEVIKADIEPTPKPIASRKKVGEKCEVENVKEAEKVDAPEIVKKGKVTKPAAKKMRSKSETKAKEPVEIDSAKPQKKPTKLRSKSDSKTVPKEAAVVIVRRSSRRKN